MCVEKDQQGITRNTKIRQSCEQQENLPEDKKDIAKYKRNCYTTHKI